MLDQAEQLFFRIRLAQVVVHAQFLGVFAVLLGNARGDHHDRQLFQAGVATDVARQVELLDDYRRTIDELMEKVDDSFSQKGKTKPFVKAMETTRTAVEAQLKQLEALRQQLKDQEAVHFLNKAVDSAKTLAEGVAGVLAQ